MGSIALDPQLSSDTSLSPPDSADLPPQNPNKRTATDANLKANGTRPAKTVKRRASKACQCCRARKVRCNVVENGPPCTNCRLDEVECTVSESKRKKKWSSNGIEGSPHQVNGGPQFKSAMFPMSAQPPYEPLKRLEHVPHSLYQDLGRDLSMPPAQPRSSLYTPEMMMNIHRPGHKASIPMPTPMVPQMGTPTTPSYSLPLYVKPLPAKLDMQDILYLEKKGALTMPDQPLRDELLRNFVEFVYPYMPLLNVHDFVTTIDRNDGMSPISLLLFQAVMFSAVATVDIRHLKAAGYASRRDARRDFFQKTRLLYDFDIEVDRISLIQSLLLLTYWYETPDDQKDSHHWMGIAVSLSHTIGLHRNPDKSVAMEKDRKKLWKRIWWSTYMRDRLVALGMRRPTRIKEADFDVPMLTIDDFECVVLPEGPSCIPDDCKILRDADLQRQLGIMCVEKARLCVCMSHVLSVQYSVLTSNHGVVTEDGSTTTTVRLMARRIDSEVNEVQDCDKELQAWRDDLPEEAQYMIPSWQDVDSGLEGIVLNRSLLHMIYYATLSALHRPQVLPSTATPPRQQQSEMLDRSRKAVRLAASEITSIAYGLFNLDMVRLLPTTGITVLLPAIIIHLLDIKAPDEQTRRSSLQGFCQCMQIMGKLRDMYAAADYSSAFLEAAIRKAEITLPQKADEIKEPRNVITSAQGLVEAGRRMQLVAPAPDSGTLTPPPDEAGTQRENDQLSDDDIARKLNSYLTSTPPHSEQQNGRPDISGAFGMQSDLEPDFDSMINLEAAGDVWSFEDSAGAFAAMSGESGGFTMDMDWSKALRDDGLAGSISASSTHNTTSSVHIPSSPPIVKYDTVVTEPSEHSRSDPALFSPETGHLPPPPTTPASLRSRDTNTRSDYYTAVWGSPYSPSQLSRSVRTAVSEQQPSEDLSELSPDIGFGLEHLIPSRLSDLGLLRPDISTEGIQQDAFDPTQTPRIRTQRWVQLPQRQDQSERAHWWSDESVHSQSDSEKKRPRAPSSTGSVYHLDRRRSRPGHNSRESNRTLDQQSFWETIRDQRSDDMSSLFESRWAATPEPSHAQQLQSAEKEETLEKDLFSSKWAPLPEPAVEAQAQDGESQGKSKSSVFSSRWADTPEASPVEPSESKMEGGKPNEGVFASRWADTPEPEEALVEQSSARIAEEQLILKPQEAQSVAETNGTNSDVLEPEVKVIEPPMDRPDIKSREQAESVPSEQATSTMRLEPPRLKKRVSWKGKNIVISIPRSDYEAAGLRRPMSETEIFERIKQFEDAGYNVHGFDLTEERGIAGDVPAQVKAIYPDETETRDMHTKEKCNVLLPDLEKWRAYTDWLTEQKLAALGVTLAAPEPEPTPTNEMSRQSSAQYPPLPFSPPIPTTSATSSMGRPTMARGHSHTMSVAGPASPFNGPAFGHMHRHSTFTGIPTLQQLQQTQQPSPIIPGLQTFSPQQQFTFSSLPRGGSPAPMSALRQEFGPGSPLGQQALLQSSQDYSRGLIEDQKLRQHAYSQPMQQSAMPNAFMQQGAAMRPTPTLPELPEDEGEDAEEDQDETEALEPEPSAYVPPHKRAQANTEIAVPTPRGHHHNISEGLERELLEAEQRQKAASRDWIEVTEEESDPSSKTNGSQPRTLVKPVEKDPLGAEHVVQETAHARKKSGARFNIAAPSFVFNPKANFQPGKAFQPSASFVPPQSSFTFGMPKPKVNGTIPPIHVRNQSSGSFNVAAPTFKPLSSEFSFSSSGPTFTVDEPSQAPPPEGRNVIDELPSIFGKVEIPDVVKPARRNKAIPIVRPEDGKSLESTEFEDDEGRVAQGDAKRKQQRKGIDDGDSVPLFAEPSVSTNLAPPPPEKVLGSNDARPMSAVDEVEAETEQAPDAIAEIGEETVEATHKQHQHTTSGATRQHGHKHSTSLSALAKPFQPPASFAFVEPEQANQEKEALDSISDLEDGEIADDGTPTTSPVRAPVFNIAPSWPRLQDASGGSSNERIKEAPPTEPSFDEIDAVMQQLNAEESVKEPQKTQLPVRLPSPGSHPMKGVTYLADGDWARSDAPSPSPRRPQPDSSFTIHERTDSGDQTLSGWPGVRQLNKAEEVPMSDWSGVLSPPDEEKLQQRSHFFENHIDKLIGRVVEQRLLPLEESLQRIHSTVNKRNRSTDLKLHRSSSNADSDADDEDDLSDDRKQRPISRGRDKRVDQIKAVVLEALREQSPMRSQTSMDLSELHSVLADMKVSFARAASASLELDDIRAVVEDTLNRQSKAVVPVASDQKGKHADHKREITQLEGRLNETLASALEEANQRRAIEERDVDSRRQLRLAEEELQLLRDSLRDEQSKTNAMEKEREELVDRLDKSEESRRKAEEQSEDVEAEKDALQATLEEYRVSSNKWRHDLEEGKHIREELEETIASYERRNGDYKESATGMKRRLEKLHFDMATAAGQLASEKAVWKAKEEDYRAKVEMLEIQQGHFARERTQLEEELRVVRLAAVEGAEARRGLENMRATNSSLDEMIRKLQADIMEQQGLAIRYERQFHDAQESGRAEVHRTRMSLETEVEAANHQVNLIRAELETELVKARTELDNARIEAETDKARHEHRIEEEERTRREAIRKVNHANSVALDEARHKYESAIQELTTQHSRALSHAMEDKQRTEAFLHEKLLLSDEKLRHYQDRAVHLEERLDVAKSAAQAAALSAKASKTLPATSASMGIPEKVSPQALRESILVLQEQLQEREARIERLEVQVDEEGPAQLKERDTEINWLRELLAVRSEELNELVETLARPNFDRAAVRDTAIRIQANLQMEQQEKERFSRSSSATFGGQAIASLANFATPKAAQFSSAFNKWRANMESSALKSQQRPTMAGRSYTPSKTQARPAQPQRYPSGLMTPPASNLRSSPVAEHSNILPPPRLNRTASKSSTLSRTEAMRPRSRHASGTSERPTTPLFREQSYDEDAEDHGPNMEGLEDDDLEDVADSEPPAFRSLEEELGEPMAMTGAADEDGDLLA